MWTSIDVTEYKTKTVVAMLKALGAEKKALIVMPEKNEQVIKSASQHPGRKDRPGKHTERLRCPELPTSSSLPRTP